MTHLCCPNCRLRFTPAAATNLAACPQCGSPPQPKASLEGMVGFGLLRLQDDPHSLPQARAVSIPIPDPSRGRP
jgi:hypothetical protein